MFYLKNISFEKSKVLNPLVADYIKGKDELKAFYDFFPDAKGFSKILKSNTYEALNRDELCRILMDQAGLVENSSDKTISNIESLSKKNVYTVTTGHQLCLFTGPLYFVYKIFSTINLAERLSTLFPQAAFVPVYWMASEDHDFEEVNHFNVFGKTIKWDSTQTGAVGDFETSALDAMLSQFKEILGNSANSDFLLDLFRKSYFEHSNLKDATRYLVNELFGKYGLIIADGNDPGFKKQAKEIFNKDIFEGSAFATVSETIAKLERFKYHVQVKPREINCFYLEKSFRGRIEKENNDYKIVGTDKKFSRQELEKIIEQETEKISPNVVLRPLYQQCILPNLAYVGGPGETAYWLEYKAMFDDFGIQFPLLTLRSFFTVIDESTAVKMEKCGIDNEDIFNEEEDLIKQFQLRSNHTFDLNSEIAQLSEIYKEINEKIKTVDNTLASAAQAEEQKTINGLDQLERKANRALRQKSETEISQIKSLKQKLFPDRVPQERYDNFATFYSKWGESFMSFLKDNINPLELKYNLLSVQREV